MASSVSRGPEGQHEEPGKRGEVIAGASKERKDLRKLIDVRFKKVGQTAPAPEQQKKLDAVAFEKSKKYHFEGTVDRASFSPKLKEKSFYIADAGFARDMLKNFDQIVLKFPSLSTPDGKGKLKTMLEFLVTSTIGAGKMKLPDGTFDHVKWKEKSEKFLGADNLYGPEGLYNVILAYRRAVDKMRFRLRDSGAKATYELRSSGKSAERSVRLYDEGEEKEAVAPPASKKLDIQRQRVLAEAKKENKGDGEKFNEVMDDYFAQRNKLEEHITAAIANGKMTNEEAKVHMASLYALNFKHSASSMDASTADFDRLALAVETLDRVAVAVAKAEKPAETVAKTAAPRELYDEREVKALADRILNMNPMKARYELAEGQTLDQLAGVIAFDTVKLIDPVAGRGILENLAKLIQPIMLAVLNNMHKENVANNTPSKIFVLDESAQRRAVLLLLNELKKNNIQSNAVLKMRV